MFTKKRNSLFQEIYEKVSDATTNHLLDIIKENSNLNKNYIVKTIKNLPALIGKKKKSAIVINPGPSLIRRKSIKKILNSNYDGTLICSDGAYVACLKEGLIPDFVITLDPHRKRIIRWFGDVNFKENSKNDDYFSRQDLDINFREDSKEHTDECIKLVNKYAHLTKAIISTSSPLNVTKRLIDSGMDMYWYNPLIDDPTEKESITKELYNINRVPCMNTCGNVGGASWVFATAILKTNKIGLVGMDYGYFSDTNIKKTQKYYEMLEEIKNEDTIKECFVEFTFPLTGEKFYTDPHFYWYLENLKDLMKLSKSKTINCTEGGIFYEGIECMFLEKFIEMNMEKR